MNPHTNDLEGPSLPRLLFHSYKVNVRGNSKLNQLPEFVTQLPPEKRGPAGLRETHGGTDAQWMNSGFIPQINRKREMGLNIYTVCRLQGEDTAREEEGQETPGGCEH